MALQVVNKYKHIPTKNDYYIGRGSPLGNIFTSIKDRKTKAEYVCNSREESINKFENYLNKEIKNKNTNITSVLNKIYKDVKSNKDVFLVCFCKPKNCHGDIIKKVIESKL